jgi:hypothetical protein
MITIIMPTYKRNDFLSHPNHPTLNLTKSSLVDKLIIVWQNIGEEVSDSVIHNIKNIGIHEKVEFKFPAKNSLNNRFYPYNTTECVLSVDDDFILTNKALEKSYSIWLKNKSSIVGFTPRFMSENQYNGAAADNETSKYNLILTQGAIFNKEMLSLYTNDSENLKLVDEIFNGEDILFNYVHNNYYKTPPLYVHDDRVKTWKRVSGNSIADRAGANHMLKRYKVFKLMKKKYGDVLITTNKRYFA